MKKRSEAQLPKFQWKRTTCVVCGKSFEYSSARAPRVCRDGTCRYKFEYSVDRNNWADYEPDLFRDSR